MENAYEILVVKPESHPTGKRYEDVEQIHNAQDAV
jgi:hypothetical protein